jgi:hypothetical protein
MPPEIQCPFCTNMVPDWHFEWHSREDQQAIFAGERAMQCPLCGAGVGFDGFTVLKSEQSVAHRDIQRAARWARLQNKSLSDYLWTREGKPYKQSWSEEKVRAADEQAANEEK